ncbi:MAG: response regulator transcription factor [Acidipropionibacterium acidipropionici]|jgi:DNA-binding NarL/FixJ family response regulator|uniref:Transcriptional regulator, LuxR family n=1 Tax=Acidipropionibacterium acidipropionici (strain ATCC 4875 / DSM 20272 / JCM 6432 / NBRC 12425 / NCIMB 8070 / 4) TaxID=1171373 RepID=K7S3R5_ACIA4|nr:response regulator transcription factor [Acidipropionibacterium acidipropionici]AFV89237.1 Transcriptional regulator, LuxR family [Acidipropionibacterium acidipropionici ATCC 4875]ALN16207.1 LuxR family transcriptional regulator [Acidipropionibacterium acidipropionici]APZ08043.1 DNA-binding response regulator [Acidipropionibacterium acidipropionici]QCV95241.1 response regulator transcription factor [Acidipropionibacterium acidipropionici]
MRVLLVDDQKLVRTGFRLILSVEPDIEVVGEAADGRQAVDAAARLQPDLVLMDVQMPVLDGIAATREITADSPVKVVVLTTFDRDDYLFDALAAGASGFMLKNADADSLVAGLRQVHEGYALLAPEVTRRVIEARLGEGATGATASDPRLELLTPREGEVVVQVAHGLSNAEIAAALFVSEATVKTHISNSLTKLDLRDRVQLVAFAYEAGLIRVGEG